MGYKGHAQLDKFTAKEGGNGMKVLIVEDDKIWRSILDGWFTEIGHEVVGTASNKDAALRLFEETNPDLVTMDGQLDNHESGLSVARAIREKNPTVNIIMITGMQDGEGQPLMFEGRGILKQHLEYERFPKQLAELLGQ